MLNTMGFFPIHLFMNDEGGISSELETWALIEACRVMFMPTVPASSHPRPNA
jgi:hypothetical protein